jgi:putative aldouronate transport system permease protein
LFNRSRADRLFDLINTLFISTGLLIILYPLYYIIIASLSDPGSLQDSWLWPGKLSLDGYREIFKNGNIWTGYSNSIMYAVLGTTVNLLFTLPAAYALSRRDMAGRSAIMLIVTFTMFFAGGLVPTYLLVKSLGMLNTVWAMIIPNAVGAWNLIIARTFLQSTIPEELLEAAKMDGCNDIKFFMRIVLPLSQALIAILVLFYGVAHWNSYFNALIFLRDDKLFPLQLVLRAILIQNEIQNDMMLDPTSISEKIKAGELIKYGVIIIASLPLLVLYPFLQKYFVKGVMIGSIKG